MKEYFYENRGLYYRKNEFTMEKLTMVFIHGLSGSSSAWSQYEKKFQDKYNILTFDLRGHGKSLKPKHYNDYKVRSFATDLNELTTYLGIRNFIVISHSFATLVVLEYMVTHGENIMAAIFLSPSFSVKKQLSAQILRPLMALSRILEIFPFSGKPAGHIDYSKYPGSGDWNIPRMIADVGNTDLRVYLYCSSQSSTFDREEFLENIKIPVLIIHGKNDTIFPVKNSVIMSKKIKNSELIILDNTDHILVLNNSIEVGTAIEKFVSKLSLKIQN